MTVSVTFLLATALYGQSSPAISSGIDKASRSVSTHAASYVDPSLLHLELILPAAPEMSSTAAELAELHRIEETRTSAQVKQAQADDREQDIFIFKSVMGAGFNADNLPMTALLSKNIHEEESAASVLLKKFYRRARPYQEDSTLQPVCAVSVEPTSYPSGHALSGYLLAYALVQMVPEKKTEIFERTEQYVRNRMICGVHYASDLAASRSAAYAIFGSLVVSPQFQQNLAAAREETRRKLGFPVAMPQ